MIKKEHLKKEDNEKKRKEKYDNLDNDDEKEQLRK